jgi:hypothetical protein
MKDETIASISLFIVLICGIAIGWGATEMYHYGVNKKVLNGLWLDGFNITEVKDYTKARDNSGQWVCVNVDKDMDYNICVNTARHECAHELWSKICEDKKSDLCLKGQELLNDYSKNGK